MKLLALSVPHRNHPIKHSIIILLRIPMTIFWSGMAMSVDGVFFFFMNYWFSGILCRKADDYTVTFLDVSIRLSNIPGYPKGEGKHEACHNLACICLTNFSSSFSHLDIHTRPHSTIICSSQYAYSDFRSWITAWQSTYHTPRCFMTSFAQGKPHPADMHGAYYHEHAAVSMLEVGEWLRGQFSTLSSRQIDQVHGRSRLSTWRIYQALKWI